MRPSEYIVLVIAMLHRIGKNVSISIKYFDGPCIYTYRASLISGDFPAEINVWVLLTVGFFIH